MTRNIFRFQNEENILTLLNKLAFWTSRQKYPRNFTDFCKNLNRKANLIDLNEKKF